MTHLPINEEWAVKYRSRAAKYLEEARI